ncbi:MAG: sulfite oxidase-like oxidoreductase [Chloroflexota bacterium]|nr:sulfite oxidase-like oxidoreductase [Dehalococcoidia bacterium]MDW8254180.1 sulfite oxidase-like oxidoreductase [Chloroflexota bacterium]
MINPFRRQPLDDSIKQRIPPGQVLTEKWPVLHYGPVPNIDLATWTFRIWGRVARPVELNWEQFMQLPQIESTSDIHCVTRWSRLNNRWKGVAAKEVLALAQPLPDARFVLIHAEYGYTANLPLEALYDDDVLFAFEHDGKPLTPEHGYPLRLVVPKRYFWKSAKWVRGVEVLKEDRLGFWEQLGYHNDADPWQEQRFWGD